jgi:hypothetical protein
MDAAGRATPDFIANAEPHVNPIGAVDYRAHPNTGGTYASDRTEGGDGYDSPNHRGTAVAPFPDNAIHGFDLPDELRAYDQLSTGTPAAIDGFSPDLDAALTWERRS